MTYPGHRKFFGSKQPTKQSQLIQLRQLICGCRRLDALPDIAALSSMYRVEAREVETLIGAERKCRHEAGVE